PYAFPVGPTRRADRSTSMPPPEPRSRTTSPGWRSARAVGFPHPREARNAVCGTASLSAPQYRFEVIGSHQLGGSAAARRGTAGRRLTGGGTGCGLAVLIAQSGLQIFDHDFLRGVPPRTS